jgi:outer membrane protein assembly factor BamB
VVAADRKTGKVLWESRLPFGGLDTLASTENYPHTAGWVGSYLAQKPVAVLGSANAGNLSADERHVYVVEDLAIPPHHSTYGKYAFLGHEGELGRMKLHFAEDLTDSLHHNRLWALDRRTGKVAWLAGGRREPGQLALPLDDAYFLGPPLVLPGKLWLLIEKDQQLQLVSLDPAEGVVRSQQPLAALKERLLQDGRRRMWSAHLASDGDVLICPTNAGVILGVDAHTGDFLWAHEYVLPPPPPPEIELDPFGRGWRGRRPHIPLPDIELDTTWHASAPLLSSGKVLINAPDEPALHCLDARTGKVLWVARREPGDLYVAGVFGRLVLLVGKAESRALDWRNGQVIWKCETGLPSGVGVCSNRTFYLPVQKSEEDPKPCLALLNLDRGVVTRELPLPHDGPLGNILLLDDLLISQTATTIRALRSSKHGNPTGELP